MATSESPKSGHSEDTAITEYGPPFDDTDADVILRSSDRVDFHVYMIILSKASPVFKTMFSFPQPANAGKTPQDSLPIVELAESSKVLGALLLVVYPPAPLLNAPLALDDFISILDMTRKYDMDAASRHFIDGTGSKVLRDSPLEAFCAAYDRQLGEAAQIAARASLKHRLSLDGIGEKLQYKDYWHGPALHKLWKYHRACSAAAIKSISSCIFPWFTPTTWSSDAACSCNTRHRFILGPRQAGWSVNTSWKSYIDRAVVALGERPCSEAVTNHEILQPFYKERTCDQCLRRISDLSEFSRMLGEEIERVVSNVSLDLPF